MQAYKIDVQNHMEKDRKNYFMTLWQKEKIRCEKLMILCIRGIWHLLPDLFNFVLFSVSVYFIV